jgi:CheY-like chemotaxis protein
MTAAPKTALLVEDEYQVRMVIEETLIGLDYGVLAFKRADQALRYLGEHKELALDVILTDIRLPGNIDGLTFAASARKHFQQTPIIITSGNQAPFERLPSFCRFLQKPWTEQDLVAALASLESAVKRPA